MNGSNGIVPTVDLATNSYPMGYGYGNSGFFGGDGIWALLILAMLFNGGFGGWGGGFGGFGGFGGMYEFPWLLTGQQAINTNTNNGFDTLHLSNQIEGVRDGVAGLSNQICNSTADVTGAITNGFYGAEISAANRQMTNMNQVFDLSRQFADCCCENRLGIANLTSTVLSENCADRAALADGLKDILINNTANTQKILDQLCADKIDAKNDIISQLRQELLYARGQASQIAQTAQIRAGQVEEVDALYDRLSNCPVPTTPVYGRTPIFTCNNNGCGCGGNNVYGTII